MRLLPVYHDMFIVPLAVDEAEFVLSSVTQKPRNHSDTRGEKIIGLYKFNGVVKNGRFSISKRVNYPQHFLPLINGTLEDCGDYCQVKLTYRLFSGTVFIMIMASVICVISALLFMLVNPHYFLGVGAIAALILSYLVCIGNFSIHQKDSEKLLRDVFEM